MGSPPPAPLLYLRTALRLRPMQWAYLPLRRLQGRPGPRPIRGVFLKDGILPVLDGCFSRAAEVAGFDGEEVRRAVRRAEAAARDEWSFLGETRELPGPDWLTREGSKLWRYHLHYFDHLEDLVDAFLTTGEVEFLKAVERHVTSWIDRTKRGDCDGWEPYPISLRTVNWLRMLGAVGSKLDPAVVRKMESSLASQYDALERRLEWHLQANHLFRNFVALALGGLVMSGARADRWRRRGLAGCWDCVRTQVLDDGGHEERSPSYHMDLLLDALSLVAVCRSLSVEVPPDVQAKIEGMLDALDVLVRPCGRPHHVNDSADGMGSTLEEVQRAARIALGRGATFTSGSRSLSASGYFRFDSGDGERVLVDCGAPGPRHQPGHAHCDVLSFELDCGGRSVIVDSGVHGYRESFLREYVRSTRAHNTVMIDGKEQSEVWGAFRMARRARVTEARMDEGSGGFRFRGAYRPFHAPRLAHHRTLERLGAGRWRVEDRILGRGWTRATGFLHLHPDFTVTREGEGFSATCGELAVAIRLFGVKEARVRRGEKDPCQGWYAPRFGDALDAPVIEMATENQPSGGPFGFEVLCR